MSAEKVTVGILISHDICIYVFFIYLYTYKIIKRIEAAGFFKKSRVIPA